MIMTFTEDGESIVTSGPSDFQVTLTKLCENAYRWTLAARKDGRTNRYKPLFPLNYKRAAFLIL